MIRLFSYDKGTLTLNVEEIKLHKEFKAIYAAIYNKSVGDVEGLKRYEAYKICTYIYLYHDWRSPYVDYDDEAKHLICLKEAGYAPNFRLDLKALAARDKYKELLLEYAPSMNALVNLRKTLRLLDNTIKVRIEKINELTDKLNSIELDVEDKNTLENYKVYSELIDSELMRLLPMGERIKKTYNDIEALEDIVKKEGDSAKFARGGKKIGNRAEPED